MEIYVQNTEKGLVPLYDSDDFEKRKLKLNEKYKVEIKKARNIKFHKKYFSLIKCAWLNLPERFDELYPHPENFRKAVQIMAGFYETYFLVDGTQIIESKSIAFESISEEEFQDVYNKVLDVILNNFFPENNREDFENEIYKFL